MAYYSNEHTPAEWNYDICDKELMAIIKELEECRPECKGAAYPLQLLTDHKNLEYCMTKSCRIKGKYNGLSFHPGLITKLYILQGYLMERRML